MIFLLVVTVTSMVLAAIMSAIAWRIAGDERRRSEARIAALAAEIHDAGDVWRVQEDPACNDHRDPGNSGLFSTPQTRSDARPFAILAGGAFVFGAAVAIAIVAGGASRRAPRIADPAKVTEAPRPALPLELLALGHERVGDQLTVRGVVRNPSSGAGMDRLTAVVSLFRPDGGFLASGRADVDAAALRPGGETTFVVTVPRAVDVARYRVSFRTDDRLIPHLDRRHES